MSSATISVAWYVGWGVGLVAVLLAVALLLTIIATAKRITHQGQAITEALDGTRRNTDPLYDVARTNLAIDRIACGLRGIRTGERD